MTDPQTPLDQQEARPRLGAVSYSAFFSSFQEKKMELDAALNRPVWIEALGVEGEVRVLKTSEELDAQARIYAPEPNASGATQRQKRATRNRRRILLALQLCAVSPSFTAEEADAAIESPESSLVVGPLFNAVALVNSIFQLEAIEDSERADDPEILVLRSLIRALAILQSEKESRRLDETLTRASYDIQVSSVLQPALDHAQLIADLLTSPRLNLLDRLAVALEARKGPPAPLSAMNTSSLVLSHARAAQEE